MRVPEALDFVSRPPLGGESGLTVEKRKRILIVDDDRDMLESFRDILEPGGYLVDTAETGREAIEKSNLHVYNLALLDIKLPDMEGTELLTKIHGSVPKMMKIMVTGHASLENAVTSVNLGADAYVMKPVNPLDLRRIVEEKLSIQDKALSMSEDKVAEWVETRLRKLKQEGRLDTEKIEITFTLPKGISWATKKRVFTLWIAAAIVTVLLWQVGDRVIRHGGLLQEASAMWKMAHLFFGFGIAAFATVLGWRAILTYALVFTGAFAWEIWEVIQESGGVSWRSYLPSFSLSAWHSHWSRIDNNLDIAFAMLGATIVVLLTFVGIALGVATLRLKRKGKS